MRTIRLDDPLGHLVPPGTLGLSDIESGLIAAMDQHCYTAGIGLPSVPTRYVVRMNPADRAWLDPTTEDVLARALTRHAEAAGVLLLGDLEIEFRADPQAQLGRPSFWAGYTEGDLLVLADPNAALRVFAGR